MASFFKNSNSPFYWIKWRNPASGKIERFATSFRRGGEAERIRAIHQRSECSFKETSARVSRHNHPFAAWVIDYLETTHTGRTLTRYKSSWLLLQSYLAALKINSPEPIRREHCLGYMAWRKNVPHLNGTKAVGRNTMLLELKVLSKILGEALRRAYIPYNPCHRLGLKRAAPRVKDELTDAQIATVIAEIERRKSEAATPAEVSNANFLDVSFTVARHQGIRLSETWLPIRAFDLHHMTLTLRGKGRDEDEVVALNPALVPAIKQWRTAGKEFTYDKPRMGSLLWFKLFRHLRQHHPGFKNISFHSTRVTVVSRLERAGAPESATMKNVLHASTTVHRGYRRVKPNELAPFWSAVSSETSPAPDEPNSS